MRYILSILFLTLASQSNAEEIVMNCGGTFYKYEKSFSTAKYYYRRDAKWIEWCNDKPDTLILGDEGAKCKIKGGITYETYMFGKMTTVISVEQEQVLDFLILRRTTRDASNKRQTHCRKLKN